MFLAITNKLSFKIKNKINIEKINEIQKSLDI